MARGKAQAPSAARANDFHGKLSSGVVCFRVLFASDQSFGQPQSISFRATVRKSQTPVLRSHLPIRPSSADSLASKVDSPVSAYHKPSQHVAQNVIRSCSFACPIVGRLERERQIRYPRMMNHHATQPGSGLWAASCPYVALASRSPLDDSTLALYGMARWNLLPAWR